MTGRQIRGGDGGTRPPSLQSDGKTDSTSHKSLTSTSLKNDLPHVRQSAPSLQTRPPVPPSPPASTSFVETTRLSVYAQRRVVAVLASAFDSNVRSTKPLKLVFCQTTHRHLLMACGVCAETMLLPADADGAKCKMTPKCNGTYTKEVALEKSA